MNKKEALESFELNCNECFKDKFTNESHCNNCRIKPTIKALEQPKIIYCKDCYFRTSIPDGNGLYWCSEAVDCPVSDYSFCWLAEDKNTY